VGVNRFYQRSVLTGLQEVSQEVEEMYAEWEEEKEHYMEQMRVLHQQMRLKELVIDLFVPGEEVHKVTTNARWNDERELWILDRAKEAKRRDSHTAKRPVSASGLRRPTTDFTKSANAIGDANPRFRSENILTLELDLPEPTTFEVDALSRPPDVQAALNLAFASDSSVVLLGDQYPTVQGDKPTRSARPGSGRTRHTPSGRVRPISARRRSSGV
jgi:kinesin family member 3B